MRRPRKSINQINVVPYIDVMLVLLVIFMVTAPLITPGEIELPTVGNKKLATPTAPLRVLVKRNGDVTLRDAQEGTREQAVSMRELVERIRNKQQGATVEQAVVIEADKDVRYDAVMRVLDALKQAGAAKVGLLVKTPAQ